VTGSRRYDSATESYFYWPPGRRGRGSVVLTRSTPRRAGPKGPPGHESDGTSRLTRMPVPCLCSLAARGRRRHAGGRHTEVVGAGGANDYFCRPGHTILGGQKLLSQGLYTRTMRNRQWERYSSDHPDKKFSSL
jgi:hypothetical protein